MLEKSRGFYPFVAWRVMSAAIIAGCIAIGAVASMLGVSTKTLRRWDKAGTM